MENVKNKEKWKRKYKQMKTTEHMKTKKNGKHWNNEQINKNKSKIIIEQMTNEKCKTKKWINGEMEMKHWKH